MDYILAVEILHPSAELADNGNRLFLGQSLSLFQHLEQIPLRAELQQEIDVALVVEVTIEGRDVGVVDILRDFHLTAYLILHILPPNEVLFDDLDRTDKPKFPMSGQIDIPIFPLPQSLSDLEIPFLNLFSSTLGYLSITMKLSFAVASCRRIAQSLATEDL